MAIDQVARRAATSSDLSLTPHAQIRFFDKILVGDDCWEWQGCLNGHGYGQFSLRYRMPAAHRVSYEHFVGPIPDGLTLDHLCRNTRCVRPKCCAPCSIRRKVGNDAAKHSRTLTTSCSV